MKNFFKNNPEANEVYTTADGNMFFTRNAAENHAKTLEDRTVTREVNPRSKDVAVVDVDDPAVASVGTIQTGEDENGNPELKQILANTNEAGEVEMHVVAVNDANSVEAQAANDASVAQAAAEAAENFAKNQAEAAAEAAVKAVESAKPATTPKTAAKAATPKNSK